MSNQPIFAQRFGQIVFFYFLVESREATRPAMLSITVSSAVLITILTPSTMLVITVLSAILRPEAKSSWQSSP